MEMRTTMGRIDPIFSALLETIAVVCKRSAVIMKRISVSEDYSTTYSDVVVHVSLIADHPVISPSS